MSITWGAAAWLCKAPPATAWAVRAAYCLRPAPPGSSPLPLSESDKSGLSCLLCPCKAPDAAFESLWSNRRKVS